MTTLTDKQSEKQSWNPWLESKAKSKHDAIFQALAKDIENGILAVGDRLPPQRYVADVLGLNLSTVNKAYRAAQSSGLVVATIGRGTFVSASSLHPGEPAMDPTGAYDLSINSPPSLATVNLLDLVSLSVREGANDPAAYRDCLSYSPRRGNLADTKAGATFLGSILRDAPENRVCVLAGAQAALYAVLRIVCDANRTIAAPAVTYPGLLRIARQSSLKVIPVDVDQQGLQPDSFENVCIDHRPAALYISPSADNPTTVFLDGARRAEVVRIAKQYGVSIIEDDPYKLLMGDQTPSFADLNPNDTWHISTLSKVLSPALRVAYVLSPSEEYAEALGAMSQAIMMMASPILTAVASHWIKSGKIQALATAMADENTLRNKLATREFSEYDFSHCPKIPHFWLRLPAAWNAHDFTMEVERHRVNVLPASSFAVSNQDMGAVRLSLGAARSLDELGTILRIIKSVVAQPGPRKVFALV